MFLLGTGLWKVFCTEFASLKPPPTAQRGESPRSSLLPAAPAPQRPEQSGRAQAAHGPVPSAALEGTHSTLPPSSSHSNVPRTSLRSVLMTRAAVSPVLLWAALSVGWFALWMCSNYHVLGSCSLFSGDPGGKPATRGLCLRPRSGLHHSESSRVSFPPMRTRRTCPHTCLWSWVWQGKEMEGRFLTG